MLKALPKSWDVKTTILKEFNDKEEMDFIAFMGNLKTHEMEMNAREEREPHKKIGVVFNASSSEHNKNVATSTVLNDEQDDTLLVKNMRRMYHKSEKEKLSKKEGKMKAMKATT